MHLLPRDFLTPQLPFSPIPLTGSSACFSKPGPWVSSSGSTWTPKGATPESALKRDLHMICEQVEFQSSTALPVPTLRSLRLLNLHLLGPVRHLLTLSKLQKEIITFPSICSFNLLRIPIMAPHHQDGRVQCHLQILTYPSR